jgi:hypothetical protein
VAYNGQKIDNLNITIPSLKGEGIFFFQNYMKKQNLGQYFTKSDPFNQSEAFKNWCDNIETSQPILEPFAGDCDIPHLLPQFKFECYDIDPKRDYVKQNDSLASFPTGYDVCITNPPYLSKSSASRMGMEYQYQLPDLYLESLDRVLNNVKHAGLIIPTAFISNKHFKKRLYHVDVIEKELFFDTSIPVIVAYFHDNEVGTYKLYNGGKFVVEIDKTGYKFTKNNDLNVIFNTDDANIGLNAIDGTTGQRIRFVDIEELRYRTVKHTDRAICKVKIENLDISSETIKLLNDMIEEYRKQTFDVELTAFRGKQFNGQPRKRIPFKIVKKLINQMVL